MTTLISRHLDVSSPPSISGENHQGSTAWRMRESEWTHVMWRKIAWSQQHSRWPSFASPMSDPPRFLFDIYLLRRPHEEMRWLSNHRDIWKGCVLPHTCRSSAKSAALRESPALYCWMITSVHILECHLAMAVNIRGLNEVIECTH